MGNDNRIPTSDKFVSERRSKKKRNRLLAILSCFVIVGTVSALTLPAITMNSGDCQLEEHEHTSECYHEVNVLSCNLETLEVHQHTDACYDAEYHLSCGLADYVIHEHDASCYSEGGVLVCELAEVKEHRHDESCYAAETEELLCGKEEIIEHTHTAECIGENGEYICGLNEVHEHTHGEECFLTEQELICEIPEHTHDDSCFSQDEEIDEDAEVEGEEEEGEETEETEEEESLVEAELQATIYTDSTYETVLEDEAEIILSGMMPENAEVKAYPVQPEIEDQEVLIAYDISIIREDGTIFEPAEGQPIKVSIKSSLLEDEDAEIPSEIYHVPDEGEPELVEDASVVDGVANFVADHFSTYAILRAPAAKQNVIYLNGQTGSDDNAGTSSSAAVKTFEKAKELLAEGGTIYISGNVEVSEAESWELTSGTVQRASGYTGPLVTVTGNGSLTLSNVTISGGSGMPNEISLVNSNGYYLSRATYDNTYATNSAKAPLIVVDTDGVLTVSNGAILQNNSNKPDTDSNGAYNPNGYVGLGGAVYCKGTMEMNGGLIENCEAQSGGGVCIEEGGKFYLSGGTINHNFARNIQKDTDSSKVYRTNAGGGVYLGDNADMYMSGGTISNNKSTREGGGIGMGWMNRGKGTNIDSYITHLTMTGGTIDSNGAISTGGGINIAAGREATISVGNITNNVALGRDSQNSSQTEGLFSGGGIYIDAEQKDKDGNYKGARGKLTIYRVIITGNTGGYSGGGIASCSTAETHINPDQATDFGTAIYGNTSSRGKELAIYNDDTSAFQIGPTVLGGGAYNWNETYVNPITRFTNNLRDNSATIAAAKERATVYITGNYGLVGGGIGCNGLIYGGGEPNNETQSLEISKLWDGGEGSHPDYITVRILEDGKEYQVIKIYKSVDENGKETWPTYIVDGLDKNKTYTIEELPVDGYETTYEQNGNVWKITNRREDTSVSVEKIWGAYTTPTGGVTMQLYADGSPYGDPVTLSDSNSWSHRWANLPKYKTVGDEKVEIVYTVREEAIIGYYVDIQVVKKGEDGKVWIPAGTLENGKSYLYVSSGNAMASPSGSSLQWQDVSTLLANGTVASSDVLWSYGGGYLQNANGTYLTLNNKNEFVTDTSGSAIAYSNKHISTQRSGVTRYLSDIVEGGYGTMSTQESDAASFTLYELVDDPNATIGETHYIITNTASVELPATGGSGTLPYTVAGGVLVVAALLLMVYRRKVQE